MNNKQVKENLIIELRELTLKINKLKIFLERDNYLEIVENEPKQAELLKLQLETMEQYSKILISRIANLEDIIKKEEQNKMKCKDHIDLDTMSWEEFQEMLIEEG